MQLPTTFVSILCGICSFHVVLGRSYLGLDKEKELNYWNTIAQNDLKAALDMKPNTNIAKNVVFFLGDGMGISTVTAGRILKGQEKGNPGEEENLVFDTFPHSALIKTYNVDHQTADSAGTATAFLCGVKANLGTVGVDFRAPRTDCTQQIGKEVTSILDWSLLEGKSVGLVSTARVTHATPAAAYAHSSERNWESDKDMANYGVTSDCKDIADQLITDNPNIQVILGGGRRSFISVNETDPITQTTDPEHNRLDGRNLIKEWEADKASRNLNYKILYNNSDVQNTDTDTVEYLLGLFSSDHLEYDVARDATPGGEPSLAELTELAIKVLQKNTKGYFLLVEGGRIDHGHHESKAKKALFDTLAFDKAIGKANELTNEADTLITVTADHSHVFTISGYPTRGNDILGLVDYFGVDPDDEPLDGKPATTLLYANGPGHNATHPRQNLTGVDISDNDYIQQSAIPMNYESHGGEDVGVFARGPMSHLFHGVREQNYIAHVMAYASCVGQNKEHCKNAGKIDKECDSSGVKTLISSLYMPILIVFIVRLY